MGIMTRQQGTKYVILSDRGVDGIDAKRAPRHRADLYQVWTGSTWSKDVVEALSFESLDQADEYVKQNYITVSAKA